MQRYQNYVAERRDLQKNAVHDPLLMMNNSKVGTPRDHVLVLPGSRDPVAWERIADIFAVLIAAGLPWSTSLVGIFVLGWLVVLAPTLDFRSFVLTLRRP